MNVHFLTRRRVATTLAACLVTNLALAPFAAPAFADKPYPAKPIRLVVPMPPAGGTDTISRIISDKLDDNSGWTIVVENKPGASGNIGMEAVAKASNDGYTIGMGQAANLAINPWLYSSMPFDPLKDFAPVALVAAQPVVLVVKGDSRYKTLAELLAAAKAKPGELRMASAGNGTIGHMSGELLGYKAGAKFLHVPYKGAGPAMTDLLGGQTDFYFITPQSAFPMIQAGRLRALAVTSPKRLKAMPNVPTVAESGFPGFQSSAWTGLVAPVGTPKAVIDQINARVQEALRNPTTIEKLAAEGSEPLGGSPADFTAFMKAEHAKWGALVKESHIKLD
jgi:tripartite-type tricarboxylate transporter receptor subunit TctC